MKFKEAVQNQKAYLKRKYKIANCIRCGVEIEKTSPTRVYCGSIKEHNGCSYESRKESKEKWNDRNPEKVRELERRHYHKNRKRNPKRIEYKKRYYKSESYKKSIREFHERNPGYFKKWREKHKVT